MINLKRIQYLFLMSGIITICALVYLVLNIPIHQEIEKEYDGILYEGENTQEMTVVIKGTLTMQLFAANHFSGTIEFIRESIIKQYNLSVSEPITIHDLGFETVDHKYLLGDVHTYQFNAIQSVAQAYIDSSWNQLHLKFNNSEKSFVSPATTKEEAEKIINNLY